MTWTPIGDGPSINKEKFEAKIYPDPNSGCFIFDGATLENGHCLALVHCSDGSSKNMYAHRIAWLLDGRELPAGLALRHLCHTPCCVNVDHLRLGTIAENNGDTAIGERHRVGKFPRGVTPCGKRWRGRVPDGYKLVHVGTFDTPEAAAEAVRVARAKMFADRGIRLVYPAP